MTDEEFSAAVQRDAMCAAMWFTGPASPMAKAIRDRRLLIEAYSKLRAAETPLLEEVYSDMLDVIAYRNLKGFTS